MRTNATDWTEAYEPYIDGIIKETVDYQVTKGGPVIGMYHTLCPLYCTFT